MLNDGTGFKKVYLAPGYTDLRRGMDGLANIVRFHYHLDPYDKGTLFLFCGRRSTRIKGLLWEGDGFLLLYKRLDNGSFRWPRSDKEAMEIWEEILETIPKKDQKKSTTYLIMKHIQAIYREEGKLKDLSSPERLEARQRIIMPMVDAFFAYLKQNKDNFVKTDKVQDALNYALNQEKHLRVFLSNGDVPIDNNASERAIRGFCIGKNYVLFRIMFCSAA